MLLNKFPWGRGLDDPLKAKFAIQKNLPTTSTILGFFLILCAMCTNIISSCFHDDSKSSKFHKIAYFTQHHLSFLYKFSVSNSINYVDECLDDASVYRVVTLRTFQLIKFMKLSSYSRQLGRHSH